MLELGINKHPNIKGFDTFSPNREYVYAEKTPLPHDMIADLSERIESHFELPNSRKGGIQNFNHLRLFNGRLPITAVLCPLYYEKTFITRNSGLGIDDSRVGIKWKTLIKLGSLLRTTSFNYGVPIDWLITFADIGIILESGDDYDWSDEINYHKKLYIDQLDKLVLPGERLQLQTFSKIKQQRPDIAGDYPRAIVQDGGEFVVDELVPFLFELVESGLVNYEDVLRNDGIRHIPLRRVRKRFADLTTFGGFGLAQSLAKQYLIFNNHSIASRPPEGLHLCLERTNQLLTGINTLARNSPQATNPRVEILCCG
jgi:hypothetical protein